MRREGYEFQVSRPEVIIKEIDGVDNEPFEKLMIDVPDEFTGAVMNELGPRKAEFAEHACRQDSSVARIRHSNSWIDWIQKANS